MQFGELLHDGTSICSAPTNANIHPRVDNNKSVQLPYGINYHHLGSMNSCVHHIKIANISTTVFSNGLSMTELLKFGIAEVIEFARVRSKCRY